MKYWAAGLMLRSPRLSRVQKREVARVVELRHGLTESTFRACHEAAVALPACTSMILMYSENIGYRRVCAAPMPAEDFATLERGGFVSDSHGFMFLADALH